MKSKLPILLLIATLCSFMAHAGGPTLYIPDDGTITLSQDALDMARFGCYTRPGCERNFVLSSRPCEGVWGATSCYVCEIDPILKAAAFCPTDWQAQEWGPFGYKCESNCVEECRSRPGHSAEDFTTCVQSCPRAVKAECPSGFRLSSGINLPGSYFCDFENLPPDSRRNYDVCTQCLHDGVQFFETPTSSEGKFYCIRPMLEGTGGMTGTGGSPMKPPVSGSGGSPEKWGCSIDDDCGDSDVCTFDKCDTTIHECYHTPLAKCSEGSGGAPIKSKGTGGSAVFPPKGSGGSTGEMKPPRKDPPPRLIYSQELNPSTKGASILGKGETCTESEARLCGSDPDSCISVSCTGSDIGSIASRRIRCSHIYYFSDTCRTPPRAPGEK